MDKLNKAREEICKDCQLGIDLDECRECLFNVFREMDKHPPFIGKEKEKSDEKPQSVSLSEIK